LLKLVTALALNLPAATAASCGGLQALCLTWLYIEAATTDVAEDPGALDFAAKLLNRPLETIAFLEPYFDHRFPKKKGLDSSNRPSAKRQ
jgi:hypothetical protein